MRQQMIEFMTEMRLKRWGRELTERLIQRQSALIPLLKRWRQAQNPAVILPEDADIVHMAPFSTIIEYKAGPIPIAANFEGLLFHLPRLYDAWLTEKNAFLLSLLPPHPPRYQDTTLDLATTSFSCKSCHSLISYPRVLAHGCLRRISPDVKLREQDACRYKSLGFPYLYPWNRGDQITYAAANERSARAIIEAIRKDPAKTTAREMDSCNIRWICGCEDHTWYLNWRMAVSGVSCVFFSCAYLRIFSAYTYRIRVTRFGPSHRGLCWTAILRSLMVLLSRL